jgi:hypothetical protein
MIKYLDFGPEDSFYDVTRVHNGVLEKTAEYSFEIQDFVKSLSPDPKFYYLLVNALGAGEHYGSNRNGDFFPIEALKKFHKTFETEAQIYKHHRNKPKLGHPSYGDVLFSHYNPRMHRVELIIKLDTEKAPDIKKDFDEGKPLALSMGARVPEDYCSICGHAAKTRAQYCDHTKYSMNKLMPDGRKVYVINKTPKFFDISFVRIPADRTAYVMAKVASSENVISSAEKAEKMGIKEADIVKKIEGKVENISSDPKRLIVDTQPSMPQSLMKSLVKQSSLNSVLSTLMGLRIMPTRDEFQKLALYSVGKDSLAEKYSQQGMVFTVDESTEPIFADDLGPSFFSEKLAKEILTYEDYISKAPLTKPVVMNRIIEKIAMEVHREGSRMEQDGSVPPPKNEPFDPMDTRKPKISPVRNPLFATAGLAGLYYGYQKLFNNARGFDRVIMKNPWLLPVLIGTGTAASMYGQEKIGNLLGGPIGRTLITVPATYLWSGHAEKKVRKGEEIGPYSNFVRKNPLIASILHSAAIGKGVNALTKTASKENVFGKILLDTSENKFENLFNLLTNIE